jgi:iduronate 2-sulfatase
MFDKMSKGMVILIGAIISSAIFSACEKKSKNREKLNVLFIAVDDLRPELGCYGKNYMHTPNIDKLASEGRIFRNHFVHCAACGPSRSTLLSGIGTTNWDIFKNIRESGIKPDSIFSLPQLFKENGYMTVCLGKISHQPGGVMDSLQTIYEVPYSWNKSYAPVGEWRDPWRAFFSYAGGEARTSYYNRPTKRTLPPYEAADVSDNGYADGLNAEEAIQQLNKLKDTTFFLAVGFYKPHLPFNSPMKYWNMYDPDKIPEAVYQELPVNVKSNICLHGDNNSYEPRGSYTWPDDTLWWQITPKREKKLKHGYCAAVSYVDAQIGKVLDELKKLGLDKNTIIVLWGDHGWHLGEYGIWGKYTNFDIALNSPLIIKPPQINHPGVFADGMVETIDIFPTLADLCEIRPPEYLEGISLKPIIENPSAIIKNYTIGERDAWGVHGITSRNEQFRLMVWIDTLSGDTIDINLFNNNEKPVPFHDISDKYPEIVKELSGKIK